MALLLLFGAACAQDAGTDVSFTGTVTDARADVDIPDDLGDVDTDASVGMVVVQSDDNVENCDDDQGTYTVYFTTDTEFDPLDTTDDDGFPEQLEGREVEIDGTGYADDDDDCTVVAESVRVTAVEGDAPPDATATPGASPAGDATPTPVVTDAPTSSPEATDEATVEPGATP